MLTINNLWQALEIAEASSAYIYRVKNGYLITRNPSKVYPFVFTYNK